MERSGNIVWYHPVNIIKKDRYGSKSISGMVSNQISHFPTRFSNRKQQQLKIDPRLCMPFQCAIGSEIILCKIMAHCNVHVLWMNCWEVSILLLWYGLQIPLVWIWYEVISPISSVTLTSTAKCLVKTALTEEYIMLPLTNSC